MSLVGKSQLMSLYFSKLYFQDVFQSVWWIPIGWKVRALVSGFKLQSIRNFCRNCIFDGILKVTAPDMTHTSLYHAPACALVYLRILYHVTVVCHVVWNALSAAASFMGHWCRFVFATKAACFSSIRIDPTCPTTTTVCSEKEKSEGNHKGIGKSIIS